MREAALSFLAIRSVGASLRAQLICCARFGEPRTGSAACKAPPTALYTEFGKLTVLRSATNR